MQGETYTKQGQAAELMRAYGEEIADLRAENDRLREALREAIPAMGADISGIDIGAVIQKARAALAGGKP